VIGSGNENDYYPRAHQLRRTGANARSEIGQRLSENGPEAGHRLDRASRREDAGGRVHIQARSRLAVLWSDSRPHRRRRLPVCSTVLGEGSPSPGIEKSKTTKAELRAALHDAFTYCSRAYDALTDASATETVKAFGGERNKLGALWFNASHNLEHYRNLVVYMRLKGIVPPSSDPKQ
jgi:hypothetical protein